MVSPQHRHTQYSHLQGCFFSFRVLCESRTHLTVKGCRAALGSEQKDSQRQTEAHGMELCCKLHSGEVTSSTAQHSQHPEPEHLTAARHTCGKRNTPGCISKWCLRAVLGKRISSWEPCCIKYPSPGIRVQHSSDCCMSCSGGWGESLLGVSGELWADGQHELHQHCSCCPQENEHFCLRT